MMEISKEYAENRRIFSIKTLWYTLKKKETETARILTTIFKDDEGRLPRPYPLPALKKDDLRDTIQVWIIFPVCSSVILHYYHIRMGILSEYAITVCTSSLVGQLSNRKKTNL